MTTEAEPLPRYKQAAQELNELFAAQSLPVDISKPFGQVLNSDWPCISYTVRIGAEVFEWHAGIGHLDWKRAAMGPALKYAKSETRLNEQECREARLISQGKTLVDRNETARLAAKVALIQAVKPNPAEVLANVCAEGLDADESFESWAANFGYDTDSRKAEETYRACQEAGRKARRILEAGVYAKMAELSREI